MDKWLFLPVQYNHLVPLLLLSLIVKLLLFWFLSDFNPRETLKNNNNFIVNYKPEIFLLCLEWCSEEATETKHH